MWGKQDIQQSVGTGIDLIQVSEAPHKSNEWFTMDVIAEGNHIVIKVNGKTMVETHDSRYKKGQFALQQHDAATVVKFSKIEVRELK